MHRAGRDDPDPPAALNVPFQYASAASGPRSPAGSAPDHASRGSAHPEGERNSDPGNMPCRNTRFSHGMTSRRGEARTRRDAGRPRGPEAYRNRTSQGIVGGTSPYSLDAFAVLEIE